MGWRGLLLLAVLTLAAGGHQGADDARSRWAKKTPEEQALLRQRFEELQKLSPDDRRVLDARVRKLKDLERRLEAELTPEDRNRMRSLDHGDRRKMVHAQIKDALREEGRRCRSRLPEDQLSRIEQAHPHERPALIHKLRKNHTRIRPWDVKRLGREIGRPDTELKGLSDLSPDQLEALALEWNRERIDRVVAEHGAPPGLTAEEFQAWRSLDHDDFYRRWRSLAPPPPFGLSSREGPRPPFSPAMRQTLETLRTVRSLSKPCMSDRVDLADEPQDARERALLDRGRERVLEYLEGSSFADAEELGKLRGLGGHEFHRALGELLQRKAQEAGLEHSFQPRGWGRGGRRTRPDR